MLGGCRIVVCSTCLSAKAAARRGKIQVEMRPFMASVAVIFGVDFTGPHILVVMARHIIYYEHLLIFQPPENCVTVLMAVRAPARDCKQ